MKNKYSYIILFGLFISIISCQKREIVSLPTKLATVSNLQYTLTGDTVNLTWESFRESVEAVESAKESLSADEERSKIAEAQYSTGFITYDNWTIIEDNIVQSKKAYLNAQANALLAEAQWINAKGETLEYATK